MADIKLRMYEMGLTQTKLSELLNVSPSRVSEYFLGKCEPTLKVAREISRKLNIDANIVLGVYTRVVCRLRISPRIYEVNLLGHLS